MVLALETGFVRGGKFFSHDGDASESRKDPLAWVASSGAGGLVRCAVPLLGGDDEPALYTVRLYFSAAAGDEPGGRRCDVKLQGQPAFVNVDVAAASSDAGAMLVREASDVRVTGRLVIELVAKGAQPGAAGIPILSGIEVVRTKPAGDD